MPPDTSVDFAWLGRALGPLLVALVIVGAVYSAAESAILRRWGRRGAWLGALLSTLAFTTVFGLVAARNPGVQNAGMVVSITAIAFMFVAVPIAITTVVLSRAAARSVPPTLRAQLVRGTVAFVLSLPLGLIAGALIDVFSFAASVPPSRPRG